MSITRRSMMTGSIAPGAAPATSSALLDADPAMAPRYRLIDIGPADEFAGDVALNDRGTVAGHLRRGDAWIPALWRASTGVVALRSEGRWARVTALNDLDMAVGLAAGRGRVGPVLWRAGQVIELPVPERLPSDIDTGEPARPVAISDQGVIAGEWARPVRWRIWGNAVSVETVGMPAGYAVPRAVGVRGRIVGLLESETTQVFRWSGETIELFDIPQPHCLAAAAWFQELLLVGDDLVLVSVVQHGTPIETPVDVLTVLYRGGTLHRLESLCGNPRMIPSGLDASMRMIGMLSAPDDFVAALWVEGETYRLSDLVAGDSRFAITRPVDINGRGEILAFALGPGGMMHTVLLRPESSARQTTGVNG
jgi:hypothetical protein